MLDKTFKVTSHMFGLLGEQLVKNENVALLELVKNAYDADASEVNVIMKEVDNPTNGQIIIEDNGCGFALPFEEIIKPFTSAKPDGMGLGLHIVSEVMKAQNGLLLFPEDNEIEDYNIPAEYESGAIIILMLNKE